jgi:hypothetical protein
VPARDLVNLVFGKRSVEISPVMQRIAQPLHPYIESDFSGYIATDEAMALLLAAARPEQARVWRGVSSPGFDKQRVPAEMFLDRGRSFCDYFLVTNGDNLYHPDLHSRLLPLMRQGVKFIAYDFVSRYFFNKAMNIGMAGCTQCRWGVAQVIYTRLDVGFVDLGSMVVAAAAFQQHNDLYCLKRALREKEKQCSNASDGHFASVFGRDLTVSRNLIRETLLLHQ